MLNGHSPILQRLRIHRDPRFVNHDEIKIQLYPFYLGIAETLSLGGCVGALDPFTLGARGDLDAEGVLVAEYVGDGEGVGVSVGVASGVESIGTSMGASTTTTGVDSITRSQYGAVTSLHTPVCESHTEYVESPTNPSTQ